MQPAKLTEIITPPTAPGQWTLSQIQNAISRPLPPNMMAKRNQGGRAIAYIPWHRACKILDKYAPGWIWEIKQMECTADRIFIIGRLSIPTADGIIHREATGTEELKEWNDRKQMITELAYGDPSSNAESMAFRRAAAKFGLGLYLYEKD